MSCCSIDVLLRVGKSGMGTKPFSSASFFCERACLLDELQRMSIRVAHDDAAQGFRCPTWQDHNALGHEPRLSIAQFGSEVVQAIRDEAGVPEQEIIRLRVVR